MTQQQYNIFLASYFPNPKVLDELIQTEDDLQIVFDIPDTRTWNKGQKQFTISVLEILTMTLDSWFDFKDETELPHAKEINQQQIIKSTQICIDFLLNKFPASKNIEVDYSKYVDLLWALGGDEVWFDDDEIEQYQNEGYRKIDLELIQYGIVRNNRKVIELLNQGANPYIDPDDKTVESYILDHLATEDSFSSVNYFGNHVLLNKEGLSYFDKEKCYDMIADLYANASSSKLHSIIKNR